jgi:Universal stress protein family
MEKPYRNIACCVDRDEMAGRIISEGLRLAGGDGSALRVVHVIAPPSSIGGSPFAYVAPIMELPSDAASWLAQVTEEIPDATTVILDGSPARTLCEWATRTAWI